MSNKLKFSCSYGFTPFLALAAAASLAVGACSGSIGGHASTVDDDNQDGDGTTQTQTGGTSGLPPVAACKDPSFPTEAPLRRLTAREYANTVRDLFPPITFKLPELPESASGHGFRNDASAQGVASLLIERYNAAAEAVAEAALSGLAQWAPCKPQGDGQACALQVALALAPRAYRRPLADDEQQRLGDFATSSVSSFGFEPGMRLFLRGLLQSPHFLYRPELGGEVNEQGLARLTSFELASRLSYLFLQTMPDDALTEAARSGKLDNNEGLLDEAKRLLAADGSRVAARDFGVQWLGLDKLDGVDLDTGAFPELSTVRNGLKESTLRFVEDQLLTGDLRSLLLSPRMAVNETIASVYATDVEGSDWQWVSLNDKERAGVLTSAGFLASTSHGLGHSPILRGTFILDRFLCSPVPSPPPDVNAAIPEPKIGETRTTREHIENTHGTAQCATCHATIDPIGFAFEHYDALGRYRTLDNGTPVNAKGTLKIDDETVSFNGAVQLSAALAARPEVARCVATQWFRFALGRRDNIADSCRIDDMAARLKRETGFQDAMLSFVASPSFRLRPQSL